MQLADVLHEKMVFLDFKANGKDEAIDAFVKAIAGAGAVDEPAALKSALLEREKLGTTGVGGGIAIPHARCGAIKDLSVAFFRSADGINFGAIDGKPVNLVFLLLAPVASGGPYLKLLAKISRLLRGDEFRQALMDASGAPAVLDIIREHE
ncbi:MAG TPA: fructose PTS transporter subunit IIA [Candidatus Ozemobacteraceae bacterium]|nr:fructose PTS transporter subunit IIA [Candidatus Ozemobacteraceae bacterium]